MATDNHPPKWRNFLIWSAMGAIVYALPVLAILSLRPGDALGAVAASGAIIAKLVLVGMVSAMIVGLSMHRRPVSLRNVRNHFIGSAAMIAAALLALSGVRALPGTASLGASETIAVAVGLVLLMFALFGLVIVTIAHSRTGLLSAQQGEDIREHGRMTVYSFGSMGSMGLALAVLGLSGPDAPLAPAIALAGALALLVVTTILSLALWPRMDELMRTLSHETGNMGFYLIVILGGGWAMLAHLGVVAAPAPLDWLTLFTLIMFAASIITLGRRGLLGR